MSAELVGEWSGHPARAGLALVAQGLDLLLGASVWSVSDAELAEAVVGLTGQAGRVEAARAVLLRESVSREVPDARGRQGARTVNLLKARCRVAPGRASADVANAKVTCPESGELRGLGAALAAGQVSGDHLDGARRGLTRLPGRVVRERRDEVDDVLTQHARRWDPGTADTLARHLLAVIAPDRADRYDEHAHERRHLGVSTDSTGMVLVSGQLDPAPGLGFTTVLD
ncbi:MAG: 13E12 repeat family protein, partial [Nocardioides sp.]|nr:13E12 repeat family protein [Nocardioides sp.]